MTILTITLWIATALLFAITNSISYNRGNDSGYVEGLEEGLRAEFDKQQDGTYTITFKREGE